VPQQSRDSAQFDNLVAELTTLYIRLAILVDKFLLLEPRPSMEEAVAGWNIASTMKVELTTESRTYGTAPYIDHFAEEFLSMAYGQILTSLEASREGSIPSYKQLQASTTKTLERLPADRAAQLVELSGEILSTVMKLGHESVEMTLRSLSHEEKQEALIKSRALLDCYPSVEAYPKHIASMFIDASTWIEPEDEEVEK
jgi:hypothetical protein